MGYDVDCCGIPHFHRKVEEVYVVMVVFGCLIVTSAVIAVMFGDD